ncbi:FxSxx-COOH system tetratricopeptide repeat protein [Dactylosporangium sp. NPDC005555]|uniref:FxSxx-COOH system tetratricopeptide repeat protein n=1 Tax=Dactylosporangium sp. NPDC005555 TaxID=3154889 RepID=UPI0033A4BF9C
MSEHRARLSLRLKEELRDALMQAPAMADPATRTMYVAELQGELGEALVIQRYPDAHHDIWSIITACETHPSGLSSLADVVAAILGRGRHATRIRDVVAEAEAASGDRPVVLGGGQVLAGHQRKALVDIIARLHIGRADRIHRSMFSSSPGEPRSPGTPALLVQRAERAATAREGVPTLLAFVDRLAHATDFDARDALHEWIDAVAVGLGVPTTTVRQLCTNTDLVGAGGEPSGANGGVSELLNVAQEGNLSESPDFDPGDVMGPAVVAPPILQQESVRLIWGGVPLRNPDFIGRDEYLSNLSRALSAETKVSVVPQTLHGFGGVGKTQLVVEWVYRHAASYDLVWWVSAEQQPIVRSSLATLAERLGLAPSEDMQQTARTVLDALAASPLRWLIVYDNADEPDDLAALLPTANGHVIVTSRNQAWSTAHLGNSLEIDVFSRDESISLLRHRDPSLSIEDANRLSDKLGDLPLALDQAAIWRAGTGMPVEEYLELFETHARELLDEGKPANYPATVYAFLRVAVARLRDEHPAAAQLLELFAYLGAEPLSSTLLRYGRAANLSQPLASALSEPIAERRAIRELRRLGLARIDPDNKTIEVHRLVQLVLREDLLEEHRRQALHNVQELLAAANPREPMDNRFDKLYGEIGPHVIAADLVHAENMEARRVVLDYTRYLYRTGDYEASRVLGQLAHTAWTRAAGDGGLGNNHEFTLVIKRRLANALRMLGDYVTARELDEDAFTRLQSLEAFGPNHEHTLQQASSIALDLRIAGRFREALAVDEDNLQRHLQVFGPEDQQTLNMRNNVAAAKRMLGDYAGALAIDQSVASQRERTVGKNDAQTLFSISNLARDMYGLGRYQEALVLQQQALPLASEALGERHTEVLLASRTVGIALRKLGEYRDANLQARDNYRRFHGKFGGEHEHTLAAIMSYANCLRVTGNITEAYNLANSAAERYKAVFGAEHPLTLASQINLGIILRKFGAQGRASELDNKTHQALHATLGAEHPFTICAATSVANNLAFEQKHEDALAMSKETLELSQRIRGDEHPYTQGCALNTAIDLAATGRSEEGTALRSESLRHLRRGLGEQHPEVVDAGRGVRTECDIEPSPM